MGILNEGVNKLRDLANSNINEADWGTGTTESVASDTGLETEISSIEAATTNTTANKTLQVNGVLVSTSGNSNSVSEVVIRFSDGTDWMRDVFTPISKTADKEIHNIHPFAFQQQ